MSICETHKQPSHVLLKVREVEAILIDREPALVVRSGGFVEHIVTSVQLDRLRAILIKALLPDNDGHFGGHGASEENTVVNVSQQLQGSCWRCNHTSTVPHFNIM